MNETILIGSDSIGQGDRQLGEMLMANFLRLLGENPPKRILFWNAGVKLCSEGRCLEHLKNLEALGVQLLLCKTCLEFYDLEGKHIGRVSNMNEIQSHLLAGNVLTL